MRRVYYLSVEYLMGRMLSKTLLDLGVMESARKALESFGMELDQICQEEVDPALGNGGLGRLAACFLDSLVTHQYPGFGYGIRYEFGLFQQQVKYGEQVERPEQWLRYGSPWEYARPSITHPIRFYGQVVHYRDEHGNKVRKWVDTEDVMAMAFDYPLSGFNSAATGNLRLWSARASRDFDLHTFNDGNYIDAVKEKTTSENIAKTLYPDDSTLSGQELRLKQEYFFVSASLQDIVSRHLRDHHTLDTLADKVVIQLNDTHPALAIPELLRILMDLYKYGWDQAWEITRNTFCYTNHTLLAEALETWPVSMVGHLLPRHLEIIYHINELFLQEVRSQFPGDMHKVKMMSLIDDEHQRVRMAHLCIVSSQHVNGVAELHSQLLRNKVFPDFDYMYPGKFVNVTNGITPRRWLLEANTDMSALLREKLGDGWLKDLSQLRELENFVDDEAFIARIRDVKQQNKVRLAKLVEERIGMILPTDAMFDIQVKRMHEYKRQLLNLLHVVTRYQRLRNGDLQGTVPRVVVFAGKAAPGYYMAKQVIRLIHDIATIINNDRSIEDRLKVVFIPDYKVSDAQIIIPACDLSEQISTAGMEASGTGNMKFALNGALTIGTLDGANIEIRRNVGEENFFLFGLTAEEVYQYRHDGYDPASFYHQDERLRNVVDAIGHGFFSAEDPGRYRGMMDTLLHGDHYMLMADYAGYIDTQWQADETYMDWQSWHRKALYNIARIGEFSSDRSIHDYANKIWKINPTAIPGCEL